MRKSAEYRAQCFGDEFNTPDGTCARDYIHVNDIGNTHLLALERFPHGPTSDTTACCLSIGRGVSVLKAIAAYRRVTGQKIQYRAVGRPAGEPGELAGSAVRATEILD